MARRAPRPSATAGPQASSPIARRAIAWPSRYAGRSWSAIASSKARAAVVGSARSSAWLPAAARTIATSTGTSLTTPTSTSAPPIARTARREGDHRGAGRPAASSSRATRCSTRSTIAGIWNCVSTIEWTPHATRLPPATIAIRRSLAGRSEASARHPSRAIATTSHTPASRPMIPTSVSVWRTLL